MCIRAEVGGDAALFLCERSTVDKQKFKQNSSLHYLVKLNHRTTEYIKLKGTNRGLAEIKQDTN